VRDFVDALVGGESSVAAFALAPAPDRIGLLALARVDYPILSESAIRALHTGLILNGKKQRLRAQSIDLENPAERLHPQAEAAPGLFYLTGMEFRRLER
jgi:hypothetical protein